MESLKSYGTLFLAPVCWHTFTLLWILKSIPMMNNPPPKKNCGDSRESAGMEMTVGAVWLRFYGNLGYQRTFPPQQARIRLDALWQQWNVNTFHQRPLSLTTFHFLPIPSSPPPPPPPKKRLSPCQRGPGSGPNTPPRLRPPTPSPPVLSESAV